MSSTTATRIALIEAGSPGLNIYSHVAMGRGVPLLATVLRDAGYDVRAFVEDISGRDSVDWHWVRGAEAIGFSAITCTLPRTVALIDQARSHNPGATIILAEHRHLLREQKRVPIRHRRQQQRPDGLANPF